ncbi:sensor histidine kinase [Aureliella helgolandensis]|uniref:histidine kinase n=1 Tax=Aureliella helgolandensis TaxID=2527968 RepID=A0A518GGA5_9BACT|nr:HAMP domain-containing sensor histidine kinase [Aureliella helgolandensis]QDV27610.1 Sensory/regulatory protein RpfC [Aureliella helgolandensis]
MKRPWQIWSLFLLCVLAVTVALAWLSLKTLRLDALRETDRAETEMARREAELQERISSALYRMDLLMLPLVSQEAARPQYLFQSFYDVVAPVTPESASAARSEGLPGNLHLPSPLLFQASESVLLYFQIDVENQISSPHLPSEEERRIAISQYAVSEAAFEKALSRIEQARQQFDFQILLRESEAIDRVAHSQSDASQPDLIPPLVAYNVPAVENFRNWIQQQELEPSVDADTSKLDAQRSRGKQRVNEEFNQRRDSTQEFTAQNVANNAYGYGNGLGGGSYSQLALPSESARVAFEPVQFVPLQPIWLRENLLLARRIASEEGERFQCCWLNWEKIQEDLQREVADLLPNVQFEPLTPNTELKLGTALTTIPVQLLVDRPAILSRLAFDPQAAATKSIMPLSLWAAWFSLGLAALASALLLHGVVRLSERRAAFVSAVTHELRTPLTTFRMYSEMLADGMVPLEKQQQYANTLKVQADRLSHLVENVLQFAQLERGPARLANEHVGIGELLERIRPRLEERATASNMQLEMDVAEALVEYSLATQPAAIEQILFNLVDNACKYAKASADNRIVVSVGQAAAGIQFQVRDFGPGINPVDRKRLFQPFQQSKIATDNSVPGVGLGLALCYRMARTIGGRLLERESPDGALFVLELPLSSD